MQSLHRLLLVALVALPTLAPLSAGPPSIQRCGVVDSTRVVADFRKFEWRTRGADPDVTWNDALRITFRKPNARVRLLAPKKGRDLNDAVILGIGIQNPGDRPVTLLGEIKTEPGAASATATLTVTADADQTANPGKMTVSLPAAQAALLTEPIYHFDVQVTWADTLIQTVLAGPVIVSAEVSVQA